MFNNDRALIIKQTIILILTAIYIFFLRGYSIKLFNIINETDGSLIVKTLIALPKIISKEYWAYLILGFLFMLVAIINSILIAKTWEDYEFKNVIICECINAVLVITILIYFSNPILTTFMIIIGIALGSILDA